MFQVYTRRVKEDAERESLRVVNDNIKIAILGQLLTHLNARIALFDERFSRGHERVPRSLISMVEKECTRFGLQGHHAVLTIGPPSNFATVVVSLHDILFKDIGSSPPLPNHLAQFKPVMIALPDLEGARASWQPVTVGHELAHYFRAQRQIALTNDASSLVDAPTVASLTDPLPFFPSSISKTRALQLVVRNWQEEVICDAYAIHRYGVAGVAALSEFLNGVGATEQVGQSHPPGYLRIELMLTWLGRAGIPNRYQDVLGPFNDLATEPSVMPDWVKYLASILRSVAMNIWSDVGAWIGDAPYSNVAREEVVAWLTERLEQGVPGGEKLTVDGQEHAVESADVVNASWVAIAHATDRPVHRLAAKALDNLDFLDRWRNAVDAVAASSGRSALPVAPGPGEPDSTSSGIEDVSSGALTKGSILARLNKTTPGGLLVTPALEDSVGGASMDVRLGNHFIIFHQSSAAAFDALDETQDPRSMQYAIEKSWGETFYLHPNQLVLAATLEYIVMPDDLTAQVVTRSSYGRLGMLSATAIQVHPLYSGCLTLELVNLGEMPLVMTPGERIAQLVFTKTTVPLQPQVGSDPKYMYPTHPEFSKIRLDAEGKVLRAMRINARQNI